MATTVQARTTCPCGQDIELSGRLSHDELAIITCAACGQRHYAGVPGDGDDDAVRIVTVADVPELYANIHAGDITCRAHAGSALRASLEAHPRRKNHETPFGTYRRADAEDVAVFLVTGLTYECETCRFRR
jgi:hypothetical protein